jgi:transposase
MKRTAELPVIGMDIAKNVFQIHIVDFKSGEIERAKLKRDRVLQFFVNRQPALVAMEACGGVHYWGRILQAQGHLVKLLPAKQVRPHALLQKIKPELAKAENRLPGVITESVLEQLVRIGKLQEDIDQLDRRLVALGKNNPQMQALQTIPGIGPLTATALAATATDIHGFRSGRQFTAWLGLTPRQAGTGGRIRQPGISKRGDPYVRTLLMHGARAIIARCSRSAWVTALLQRRPYCVVVAALANKLARTAWAVLIKGVVFDQVRWSPTEMAT